MSPTDIPAWLADKASVVGECWIMSVGLDRNGYSRLRADGALWWAHRWVWSRLVGPVPDGLQLDHLCRNRACVRPDHLEPVSASENVRRSTAGVSLSHVNGDKTHCMHGHIFDAKNTYYRPSGGRSCRACLRARRGYSGESRPKIDRTHCPKGHPYDNVNTHWMSDGTRRCRECNRINARRQRQKRTSANASRRVED